MNACAEFCTSVASFGLRMVVDGPVSAYIIYMSLKLHECHSCRAMKPASEFNVNLSRKSGLTTRCKDCIAAYYQAHRDIIIRRSTEWNAANPDRVKASQHRYRQKLKLENLCTHSL